jgi:hypothetical protein
MDTCYVVRSPLPAWLFSCGLLDGLHVRLRRRYVREAQAGFRLERLATALLNFQGKATAYHTLRISETNSGAIS